MSKKEKRNKKPSVGQQSRKPHATDILARCVAVTGLLFAGITLALNYGDYLEVRKKPDVTRTEIYAGASFISGKDSVEGNCWTTSSTSFRVDAFRCSTSNTIADPCFINFDTYSLETKKATFYCPDKPSVSSNDLAIVSPIPEERRFVDSTSEENFKNLKNKLPWFITLNEYGSCRFSSGAGSTAYDGINVNYICDKNLIVANEIRNENGNVIFRCKHSEETTFYDCKADLIVY